MSQAAQHLSGTTPGRFTRVALVATVCAAGYLDFFYYRAQGYLDPNFFNDRLRGVADAPDQYRIGIVWLAHLLVVHLHIALTMAVASIDTLSGLIAVLTLSSVLERTALYREATGTERWFAAISFVLVIQWFLAWLLWLQKPETLPATMLVALMLWLWQSPITSPTSSWLWRAPLLLALNLLLATFRADMTCLLNAGIFLFVLLNARAALSLPRLAALGVTLTNALIAAGLQLYFMRVAYPHATYGKVKLWQFRPNLIHASRWPPFILFLLPLFWMLIQLRRHRAHRDSASFAFVFGAALFFLLWIAIGKIDEVRIFLPFAFALAPLTAQMAILHLRSIQRES